ncbi:hypothetical protein V5O39_24205 [Pseudomonas parakoreensis]
MSGPGNRKTTANARKNSQILVMSQPFRCRFGEQSLGRKGGAGACEVSFKKPQDWHNLLSFAP